ncbi:Snf7-domain-containing protein [Geopyxis carbonaria]|nr:Snf7-domain-containing protein [Geopyxis carbonaria]
MSGWLGGWFGGGSASKKSQASKEAILGLRTQLDMLQKREAHTEKQIIEQENIARKHVQTNKTIARNAIKKKKQLEQNLTVTQQHINTLETQMNAVENANINIETISAMKKADDAMRKIHGQIGIEKVDDTMDQIRESMANAEEVSQAITSVTLTEGPDEDEIRAEIEAMEQEALDKQMLGAPSVPAGTHTVRPRKPTPPSFIQEKLVLTQEDDEEAELRKLQAEMAM